MKVRADIEVTCFEYEGVDAVKKALKAGLATATEEFPVQIQLVSSPLYVLHLLPLDKDRGIEALNAAIAAIRTSIEASGGALTIRREARAEARTINDDDVVAGDASLGGGGGGAGDDDDDDDDDDDA